MKKVNMKLPNILNLGAVLPGQYGEAILPLYSEAPAFMTLELDQRSITSGFFLLKEGSSDAVETINIVVKPKKMLNIMVGAYSQQVTKSTVFNGELKVQEESKVHKIRLLYRIEVPCIFCKKMLEDSETKTKMLKLIVNKAVTNDTRICLHNSESYPLTLEPSLFLKSSIKDSQCPYILKVFPQSLTVEPNDQFTITINFQTNIGYKKQFSGMKKVLLKNILLLRTNSVLFWCLPVQIMVVFVKQMEFKDE